MDTLDNSTKDLYMKHNRLYLAAFGLLSSILFVFGCSKGVTPLAPAVRSSTSVRVPMADSKGHVLNASNYTILYSLTGGDAPVTGSVGPIPASSVSNNSYLFTINPSSTNYNFIGIQVNDSNAQTVLAVGAESFTFIAGGTLPVTLGPINQCYDQPLLPAGSAFGFENNTTTAVGVNTATSIPGLDMVCNPDGPGYALENAALANNTVAYVGNGSWKDFLYLPPTSYFFVSSGQSKGYVIAGNSGSPSSYPAAVNDVYCVKILTGGYAWLQVTSVTGGIGYIFRPNTTLPYCGYELSTIDQQGFCHGGGTPTYTATPLNTNTQTSTSTTGNTSTSTPSNTPTNTTGNTSTSTPSNTPTNTAASTFTSTNSATNTCTNSPTNTAVSTSTGTSTATSTSTNSSTNTPVSTSTGTSTSTNTSTNTPTNTGVNTMTATGTATNTSSNTATDTPASTATNTATSTATNSPTSSSTQTSTDTVGNTSTLTSTDTPTSTSTNTPSQTATDTVGNTSTMTSTDTPTSTSTDTPTSTATDTVGNTSTATMTSTDTSTDTATSTTTDTDTPLNTATPTMTFTNTVTPSTGVVTTLAGQPGVAGSSDGTGNAAGFKNPNGIAIDGSGNLFITDSGNNLIREIAPGGVVTTIAGQLTAGTLDGTGSAAQFSNPSGIAVDSAGTLYVADYANHTIRQITTAGVVTTIAGTVGVANHADGTGTSASFYQPSCVVTDNTNLFICDNANSTIRKMVIATGVVTTVAGTALTAGNVNGVGTAAQFNYPTGIALDSAGDIFVADTTNNLIRKIDTAGNVTTVAGANVTGGYADGAAASALFKNPVGVAVDASNNIFVADAGNNVIRKIDTAGNVTTVAGNAASAGFADGVGGAAQMSHPSDLVLDAANNIFFTDGSNQVIRKIN